MIRVRLLGHIRTSVGTEVVELPEDEIEASELVERLRSMCSVNEPGFDRYNTIAMVEGKEAFVPAGRDKKIRGGDTVVLIPFSHGG